MRTRPLFSLIAQITTESGPNYRDFQSIVGTRLGPNRNGRQW
jgi:hypothetical protein